MRAETASLRQVQPRSPWQLRLRSLRPGHPLLLPPRPNGVRRRMMSSSTADSLFSAAVVTVSDSCSRGEREDRSGPAVAQLLERLKFSVSAREVVSDDKIQIQNL